MNDLIANDLIAYSLMTYRLKGVKVKMDVYYSIKDCESETVISRSRFIAKALRITSEDEAAACLKGLEKQYSDATHVCYAYVADRAGVTARFSDGGEPSGTAGRPILDAIIKNGLKEVMVAVIRYFGGIKLGAGGLTRAYGGSATDVLNKAQRLKYVFCDVYCVEAGFAVAEKLKSYVVTAGKLINAEYSDCVVITAAVPCGTDFIAKACDIAGGRVKIEKINTQYLIYD